MALKDYIDPKNILFFEDKIDKSSFIVEMCAKIWESNLKNLISLKKFKEKIIYRESLMSTGIGLNLGIPHARVEGMSDFVITLAVSLEGIDKYDSIDDEPVHIVFMIIGPMGRHKEHVRLMGEITELIKSTDLSKALLSCQNIEDIQEAVKKI